MKPKPILYVFRMTSANPLNRIRIKVGFSVINLKEQGVTGGSEVTRSQLVLVQLILPPESIGTSPLV